MTSPAFETRLYRLNLTGAGMVAGVLDTGLDLAHAAFADPLDPVGARHRKVAGYDSNSSGDALDSDGHGTHVCGSLAGSDLNDATSIHNGQVRGRALALSGPAPARCGALPSARAHAAVRV